MFAGRQVTCPVKLGASCSKALLSLVRAVVHHNIDDGQVDAIGEFTVVDGVPVVDTIDRPPNPRLDDANISLGHQPATPVHQRGGSEAQFAGNAMIGRVIAEPVFSRERAP